MSDHIKRRIENGYIVLREAAVFAGYSSDYIGWLIRKGKITGRKVCTGAAWQTTPRAILEYKNRKQSKELSPSFSSFINLKKFISLKEAAEISGYAPDYIGWLIRRGKIDGRKINTGAYWQTTERAVRKYQIQIKKRKKIIRLIPKKRDRVFYFVSRFSLAALAIFFLVSGFAPVKFLQGSLISAINAIGGEDAKIINFYSSFSEGAWQNKENAQGPPDVSPAGDINSFSEENSASYQTGPKSLVVDKFDTGEDLSNYNFQSAKIKFSFAVGERKADFELLPIATTTIAEAVVAPTEVLPTDEVSPKAATATIEASPITTDESTTTIERPGSESSIINRGKNFVTNLLGRIKAQLVSFVFKLKELGFKAVEAEDASTTEIATTSEVLSETDAKIIIWYSLADGSASSPQVWKKLVAISDERLSNAQNGGYFEYDASFINSFEDNKNLKIKFEGVVGGEAKSMAYLDSVWVEASYREKEAADANRGELEDFSLEDDFQSNEEPEFRFRYVKNNRGMLDGIGEFLNITDYWQDIDLTAKIKNSDNEEMEIPPDLILENNGEFSLKIKNPRELKPGFYKIVLQLEEGGEIKELVKDFSWGVLALNVNKSIYLPNERAYIQMAALDDGGHTIFDADLTLEITAPDGTKSVFKTPLIVEASTTNQTADETADETAEETIQIDEENPEDETTADTETTTAEATTTESVIEESTTTEMQATSTEATTTEATTTEATTTEATTTETTVEATAEATTTETIATSTQETELSASTTGFLEKIKNRFSVFAAENQTEAGVIERSGETNPNSVTYTPDYYTYYQIKGAGVYQMNLTAITKNGVSEITDSFEVRESLPFEVERIGPTRIYPPASYEMKIKIKVNQDFKGEAIESAPSSFEITEASDQRQETRDGEKIITWDVNWKAGEEYELRYQFDAPDVSPYLYLLGPLSFTENSSQQAPEVSGIVEKIKEGVEEIVEGVIEKVKDSVENLFGNNEFTEDSPLQNFGEARQWQVAADAVTNNGILVYDTITADSIFNYQLFTDPPPTWGGEGNSSTTAASQGYWLKIKAAPTRNEKMVGVLAANGTLYVQTWNGTSWNTQFQVAGVTGAQNCITPSNCYAPFDIAYEQLSGRAIVAYATSGIPNFFYYRVWDGSNWVAGQTAVTFSASSTVARFINLKAKGEKLIDRRSNEILLSLSAANGTVHANYWNGSSFATLGTNATTVTGATNCSEVQCADVAWESVTGRGFLAWGSAIGSHAYRKWVSGTGWDNSNILLANDFSDAPGWGFLASDPVSDRIAYMSNQLTTVNDVQSWIWKADGSTEGWTASIEDTVLEVTSAPTGAMDWQRQGSRLIVVVQDDANVLNVDGYYVDCTASGCATSSWGTLTNPADQDDGNGMRLVCAPNATTTNSGNCMLIDGDIDGNLHSSIWNGTNWAAFTNRKTGAIPPDVSNDIRRNMAYDYAYNPYSPLVA